MKKTPYIEVLEPLELSTSSLGHITDYETIIESRDKKILDAVERRLREAEKNKEFKDTQERKRGTQKEMRAYSVVSSQILDDLEEDPIMAKKLVVKTRVWPEGIDWKEEKKAGTSSGAAFLKTKIYTLIARQPYDSADARRVYIAFLNLLKETLTDCRTVAEVRGLLKGFSEEKVLLSYIGDLTNENISKISRTQYRRFYSDKDKAKAKLEGIIGKAFHNYIFSNTDAVLASYNEAIMFDGFSAEEQEAYVNRMKAVTEQKIEKIKEGLSKYRDYTDKDFLNEYVARWTISRAQAVEQSKSPNGMNLIKQRVTGAYRIEQHQSFIENLKKGDINPLYKTRKETWSWTSKPNKKESLVTEKIKINTRPKLNHVYRNGGLIIPEFIGSQIANEFKDELGIKSVQFGNSLPDDERRKHAQFTFASFTDLEDLLNVSIKGLNSRHDLGIDFATRGTAGSAATYWSDYKVININRKSGDGSLAHEWAHYLDNALSSSTSREMNINGKMGRYATLGGSPIPIISTLINKWWNAATIADETTKTISVIFWADNKLNLHPSNFKNSIDETIAHIRSKRGYDEWHPKTIKKLAEVYGSVAAHFGVQKIVVNLKSFYTNFYAKSQAMDGAKVNPYWASPVEMFARSFEEYIMDLLTDRGMFNNYLQSSNKWAKDYGVYPEGSEKERINLIFDDLFSEMRKIYPSTMDLNGDRLTTEQIHPAVNSEIGKRDLQKKEQDSDLKELFSFRSKAIRIKLKLAVGINGIQLTYAQFSEQKPTLWGSILVNRKVKFGKFLPRWNKYSNSLNYMYFTETGNRGSGGFTLRKAYELLCNGSLSLENDFVEIEKDLTDRAIQIKSKLANGLSGFKNEAELIKAFTAHSEPFRFVKFSESNYFSEFGVSGEIETPIGTVIIDFEDLDKIEKRFRQNYFGLLKPTLVDPLLIVKHENRELFIKSFNDRKRGVIYFVCVAKDEFGYFSLSSAHEKAEKSIIKKIREGSVTYQNSRIEATGLSGTDFPHRVTTAIEIGIPYKQK